MANKKKYASLENLRTFKENIDDKFATKTSVDKKLDASKYVVDSQLSSTSSNPVQNKVIDAEFEAISTAMNALESEIDGKADSSHSHSNYVPTSRTVNGKSLSSNITLSASDVGALPNTTNIPDSLSDLSSDSTHRTVTDAEKATWNAKSDFSGSYNDLTDKPTIPSISGLATETYVNDVASTKVDKVSGKGLSTNDYTTTEKNKLSGIASGAEVNQNAFSNVVVGSTTIVADSKTDSLTVAAGGGISVSGDATNDKVTITNSGVRSIATGSSNGTISVNTNGTATDVAVKGLGSAAYTSSSAYDAKGSADTALASAKSYADTAATNAANAVKNDLLNGAGTAYDTLKELGDLIDTNVDAIDALETVAAGKANKSHTHGNITNAGAIGTASGKAVVTTTNGVLTTGTVPVASGGTGATTAAGALTNLGLTATAAELNKMDGVTATTTELNYVDGVTSNIQTQLDGKVPTSRTVNGKALSSNISLTAADVGASASGHTHSYLPLSGGYLTGTLGVINKYELGAFYSYANGCLIDICSAKSNTMVAIHVTGNSYSSNDAPIDSLFQFYDYSDGTIKNYSGVNLGLSLGAMTVYRHNGRLYAHIKQTASYQTLSFTLLTNKSGLSPTVSNTAAHTSGYTDLITITPINNITSSNIGSQSVNYATSAGSASSATKATKDGSGNTITSTYATKTALDTLDAAYDAHKHTVSHTPAGTVSKPTFTGSAVNSGTPSGTTSVYSITGVGSAPSLTAAVSNRCLTFTWSAGSVPTRSSVTVASSDHKHSVTASGSVSQPTFTGTAATLTTGTPT